MIVPISRRYEPGTLVIETTWVTDTGWVGGPRRADDRRVGDLRRQAAAGPTTDHESDHSLLRTMTCIDGEVEMEMECLPRFDYGARGRLGGAAASWARRSPSADDGTELRLTSDMELTIDGGAVRGGR